MTSGIVIEGRPAPPPGQELEASYRVVSPDYFKALGIDLISGRQLTESDDVRAAPVVLINEQLAQRYWPNESPIGKRIIVQRARMGDRTDVSREVVGVVRTYKHWGLDRRTQSEVYVPYLQTPFPTMALVVRSASSVPPAGLTASVRNEIHSVDKDLPVFNVKTMDQVVSESVVPQRLSTMLLGVFAVSAMMLAGIGIYGIVAYFVTNSSHNIGIRMALGASPRNILKLVVAQGMILTLVGIGIGALAAFAVARLMKGLLVGVSTTDPMVFAGIALLLAIVALMASFIPARRATKVDPLVVLRYE
jgi:putative ABC transport system permease protein